MALRIWFVDNAAATPAGSDNDSSALEIAFSVAAMEGTPKLRNGYYWRKSTWIREVVKGNGSHRRNFRFSTLPSHDPFVPIAFLRQTMKDLLDLLLSTCFESDIDHGVSEVYTVIGTVVVKLDDVGLMDCK